MYTFLKIQDTYKDVDSKVESRIVDRHFDSYHVHDLDKGRKGMQIAFGYSGYPSPNELLYEPEYAEIKLKFKKWGTEEADGAVVFEEIQVRPCTDVELGLGPQGFSDPKSKFYHTNQDSLFWL